MATRAYVLGSDKNQLDLAKMVMDRLDRITSYPVIFNYGENGWFDKPKFVRQALNNYDAVCWLDNDIQILRNFDEIFDYNIGGAISGVPDYLYPFCLNAGVLVFQKFAMESILDWDFVSSTYNLRSDQEALQVVRERKPSHFGELPMIYNHQKFAIKDGNKIQEDTAIVHWTGEDGKQYLRA